MFKEIEKQNCFFKDFFLMKIMSKLIYRFVEDLVIPDSIRDNLFKKRDNEQLKIFALSIPTLEYPDTYILAGRLLIYVNIKLCPKTIEDYVQILTDVLRPEIKEFILKNSQKINQVLDETYYENFEKQNILSASAHTIYLLRLSSDEPPIETPCMCNLRQAIEFYHEEGIDRVIECYHELNDQLYVHASPTRFNACCKKNQLSSCFLITLGDNIEDILYTGVGDTGMISKLQGGIGMHLNNIRHSQIGNAGKSGGIMPFTETFDKNTKCVNQGTKRNGAATLSINIWHIDVIEFTQARDNYTHNGVRFKSANTCLFISDLFMERVKQRGKWTVFCPAKAKINGRQLSGTYGAEFEEIYHMLEEAAPKMQEEFDNFTKEIEKMELEINSNQDIGEDYIREYHSMVQKRLKMRKNLIEYKVLDAVKLYDLICDMNVKSGQPYITYRDAANIKNNMMNIGVTEGSNLCVAPETLILTDKGQYPIIDLIGKKVNVWNGKEFSLVEPKKTAENQELIKIKFSDNSVLECTKYHKFYIQTKYHKVKGDILKSKNVKLLEAQDLEENMKLVKCNYPIVEEGEELKDAYTNGFFSGDGTYIKYHEEKKNCDYNSLPEKAYCKRHIYLQKNSENSQKCQGICYEEKPMITLYHDKIKLLENINYRSKGNINDNKLTVLLSPDIEEKFFVPINYNLESKLTWLSGYIDADGCVLKNEDNQSIQITSIREEFLLKIKFMLQTCGCNPKIGMEHEECERLLPDGKGGKKLYQTKKIYRMVINSNDTQILLDLGLKTFRLKLEKRKIQRSASKFIKVKEIIKTGRISDTYCFTEHKRNAGVFNGIFSSQCLEIMEPTSPKDIASCNLGHINLKRFVSRPPEGVEVTRENLKDYYDFKLLKVAMSKLVENINKVIDHNYYPLDKRDPKDKSKVIKQGKISRPNLANRPIGIGVSGLAEVFALLNLPFDSDLAKYLNKMIFGAMYYYGLEQSHTLAQKHGEYSSFRSGESKIFVKDKGWQTFKGSPLSNGFLQFDLWQSEADYLQSIKRLDTNIYKLEDNIPIEPSQWGEEGSWKDLRYKITQEGVYNSMLLAPMPTASTSQLVRNAECFEAHQTLVYSRKLVHGNITTFSEPFVEDMQRLGLWNSEMIEFIEMDNGSIRYIDHFINDNRDYFKDIVWDDSFKEKVKNLQRIHRGMYEISQKDIMLMSRQRGIYVDQSQSMNIYIAEPTKEKMMAVHAYSSALKLKTGMYYLRQNPASQTDRFTVKLEIKDYFNNLLKKLNTKVVKKKKIVCTDEVCIMCQ